MYTNGQKITFSAWLPVWGKKQCPHHVWKDSSSVRPCKEMDRSLRGACCCSRPNWWDEGHVQVLEDTVCLCGKDGKDVQKTSEGFILSPWFSSAASSSEAGPGAEKWKGPSPTWKARTKQIKRALIGCCLRSTTMMFSAWILMVKSRGHLPNKRSALWNTEIFCQKTFFFRCEFIGMDEVTSGIFWLPCQLLTT